MTLFSLNRSFHFDNFVGNDVLINKVKHLITKPQFNIWLQGSQHSGKTHLLQAIKKSITQTSQAVFYSKTPTTLPPAHCHILLIDNAEHFKNKDWLYDWLMEGKSLNVASQLAIAELDCKNDVKTRLGSDLIATIQLPNEQQVAQAIKQYFDEQQWQVSEDVIDFLMKNLPRNIKTIFDFLTLVSQKIAGKEKLTKQLIARLL